MTDSQQDPQSPLPYARRTNLPPEPSVLTSLISAGLFLYVGFGLGLVGVTGDALYDGAVATLVWGARFVGFAILLALLMSMLKLPGAAVLDLISAIVAALLCFGVGAVWMYFGDTQGFWLLIFGFVNASAARSAWNVFQHSRSVAGVPGTWSDNPPGDS